MPSLMATAMALANRLLPGPARVSGDRTQRGRDSQSRWAPSVATALSDRAAVANNEL
jgi:hypothetical protein